MFACANAFKKMPLQINFIYLDNKNISAFLRYAA